MHKKNIKKIIFDNILVIFGAFLLAIGTGLFQNELSIVSGGVTGIGLIVQYFVKQDILDWFVLIVYMVLWLLGLIFVGKQFALKTLVASIAFPGFLALFIRIPEIRDIARYIAGTIDGGTPQVGNIILCAIFGGIINGFALALTFLGGGSTGGVDVIIFIVNKYLKVRESITCIIIDATVILIAMILFPYSQIINCLCGILVAVLTALIVEVVYVAQQSSYQADIISEQWEKINRFAQDELFRGTTIIRAEGGYKGTPKVILRVVFDKSQYEELNKFIFEVDPTAFVTFTRTTAVFGEGFKQHYKAKLKLHNEEKKNKELQK